MTSHPYAVISGANRGIGLAIAKRLARRNLGIAAVARSEEKLAKLKQDLSGFDVPFRGLCVDVADAEALVAAGGELAEDWGAPEAVIANAGVLVRKELEEMSISEWNRSIDVNLRGAVFLVQPFVGAMKKAGKGRIIAVGSISSTIGTPTMIGYNASKWGMVGFIKSLTEELRGTGVQALVVNPGSTDTDMLKDTPFEPQMTPDDVAKLVEFAAMDAPNGMNGSALDIFGP